MLSFLTSAASSSAFGGYGALEGAGASIIARSYTDDYDQQDVGTDDYDDEYGRARPRRGYVPRDQGLSTFFGLVKNPKQVGGLCVLSGVALTFMGMMLFFEGNLLRLGNMLIIFGIPLLLGIDRVKGFFLKESRTQASVITAFGILLVFWGKPRLGLLCEIFGLLNLFGNMFPLLFALGRRLPVIGDILGAFEGGAGSKNGRSPARPPPAARRRYEPDF